MKILVDGVEIANISAEQLPHFADRLGIDVGSPNVSLDLTPREVADDRAKYGDSIIHAMHNAGYPQTRLIGLLADSGQDFLVWLMEITVAISEIDEAQKQKFTDNGRLQFSQNILAALASGQVAMPGHERGIERILNETAECVAAYQASKP